MATPLETFVEQLHRFGLLDPDQARPGTPASASSAQDFARELVRSGLLTRYQAVRTLQGAAQELVLGQYVILDKVGAGGMGEVFKARHRAMGRVVALKVLPRAAMDSPDAVRRFKREAKAAARLTHPNIVTAFDADETGGVHYLVMEFVDGEDLHSLCRREGSLPFEQAVNYILQAAQGLAYAHAHGVIHRDIKPHNLLLDREGNVKILDMGLARLEHGQESSASSSGLTGSGAIMGTLDYMPPEQAEDTRQADQRSDIYSLGCTLYRLVVGENAYRGQTVVEKLLAHRQAAIPSIVEHRPEAPKQLDEIFRRMVAKRPEDRYPSIEAVIHDLKALASGRPLKARPAVDPPSEDSKLVKFFDGATGQSAAPFVAPQKVYARRKKRASTPGGLAAVAALGLLLIAGFVYVFYSREKPSVLPAAASKPEKDVALPSTQEPPKSRTQAPPTPPASQTPPAVQGISPDGPSGEVLVAGADLLKDIATSLCFTADGKQVLLGGRDGVTRLLDLGRREVLWTEQGLVSPICHLLLERDGRHYLTAGIGVRRLNLASRQQAWSTPQDNSDAWGLACSHDGQLVAAAFHHGKAALWNRADGTLLHSWQAHEARGRSVAFSPDDRRLISCGGGELPLVVWNMPSGMRDTNLPGHEADVQSVAISPDGRFAASGDISGTLLVWDFPHNKQLHRLDAWHDHVHCLAFSPDSRWLISCGHKDKRIRMLDVQTGEPITEFRCLAETLRDLNLSRDGRLVAVSTSEKALRVFRLPPKPTEPNGAAAATK